MTDTFKVEGYEIPHVDDMDIPYRLKQFTKRWMRISVNQPITDIFPDHEPEPFHAGGDRW